MQLLFATAATLSLAESGALAKASQAIVGNRNSFVVYWPGGEGDMRVRGTWDSATVTLKECPFDESPKTAANFLTHVSDATNTALTADGAFRFFSGRGYLMLVVSTSSGSDALRGHIDAGSGDNEQANGMSLLNIVPA